MSLHNIFCEMFKCTIMFMYIEGKEALDAVRSSLAIVPTEDTIVLRHSQFCQAD